MELQSHSLSSNQKRAVQEWLSHNQADVFVSLLENKIFKLESEIASDIADSQQGGFSRDDMITRAKSKAGEIDACRQTIAILREVRDAETLVTYTATPTKT